MTTKTKDTFLRDLSETQKNTLEGTGDINNLFSLFPMDKNVRDAVYGYKDVEDHLESDLVEKGHVIDAVVMAVRPTELTMEQYLKMNPEKQSASLEAMKGFRRIHLSNGIVQGMCDLPNWKDFDPKIPIKIVFGLTEEDICNYKLDHGTIKTLNEWELVKCLIARDKSGQADSGPDTVYALRSLFGSHQSIQQREKLEKKLTECPEYKDPIQHHNAHKTIIFEHFKGRYQKLIRIARAAEEELRENFRSEVYGGPDAIHFTNKEYVLLWDKEGDDFQEAKKAILNERTRTAEATKINKWSKKDVETKLKVWKSDWVATILNAAYGDEIAQRKVTDIVAKIKAVEDLAAREPEKFAKLLK